MAKSLDKKKETKKKPEKTLKEKRADKAAKKRIRATPLLTRNRAAIGF